MPVIPSQKKDSSHVNALDGIRGLAILLVLGHHLLVLDITASYYQWVDAFRESFWCGVDVFFALSGFLITGILIKTVNTHGFFRNFYARRSLRIFPLYYAVVLGIFAYSHFVGVHWAGQQWHLLTYTNRIFLDVHQPGWNMYAEKGVGLVNLWSLHVEEQFYFIWPLLVFLVRRPRRLLPLAAGLSLASIALRFWLTYHGVAFEVLYASLFSRADNLLIGGCLAILLQTRYRTAALRASRPVFFGTAAVLAGIFVFRHGLLWHDSRFFFAIQFTLLAVVSTALIGLCLDPHSFASRMFSTRFMRFFGKYSYGLYIFHSVLPIFLDQPLHRLFSAWIRDPELVLILISLVILASSIAVSVLSFRFFEMPFLRLKRYFEYRRKPTIPELPDPVTV
jgi:peptidoglycan/LPS O-acetylase OafA/YrhL